jgi:hypothetical protein
MALQGITPVQPRQQQKVARGGKLAGPLAALGGLAGAAIGTMTAPGVGTKAGATLGAKLGAGLGGLSAGLGAGSTLGSLIDPARTKTVTQGPQMMGQIGGGQLLGGGQSLSQKYKMSDAGRMALEGLQVAKAVPEYQQYQEPLAMAILQDISANNRQRIG